MRAEPHAVALRAAESAALADFTNWVRERFGARVHQVILYGSRARGGGNEDSDLDVLVVIDGLTSSERREIGQRSGDAMTGWDVLLSPLAMSVEHLAELRERERLLAREIERDGVPL